MTKMLIDRATVEQVLEALDGGGDSWQRVGPAIDALKAALAEPVPVDRCANCLRPKGEHQGDMCPRPYTTVWSAWDYEAALAEPQEPDSPERRCGGPGCDGTCCQPVQERSQP